MTNPKVVTPPRQGRRHWRATWALRSGVRGRENLRAHRLPGYERGTTLQRIVE